MSEHLTDVVIDADAAANRERVIPGRASAVRAVSNVWGSAAV